jgi:hypothetical protein
MTAGGVDVSYIARWDGATWSGLGSEFDGGANALVMVDGKLYAAGSSRTADGIEPKIARWDGNRWSGLGMATSGWVDVIAASGRTLYVVGSFTTAGGKASYNLARVFPDGVPPLEVVNGHASVYFRGTPAGAYRIERTTDLKTWEHLATRYAAETGGIDFVDENTEGQSAYYRATLIEP